MTNNSTKEDQRERVGKTFCAFALIAASFIIVTPLLFMGLPSGNDLPQHYQFAIAFKDSLANGEFYPSWSPYVNHGFGDVGVRFYPPFSYYVLVGAEILTGNWFDASILTFWLWFAISGFGVFLWARESYSRSASLLAGITYIWLPYHANQLFNAFTYAEFAAASVLPFCFLFVFRVIKTGAFLDIAGLAGSYALLVLTHLPLTVIGSIAITVYGICLLRSENRIRSVIRLAAAAALGILLSSFYWVRMAAELHYVRHATVEFRSNAYDFSLNFLTGFFHLTSEQYDERSLWFGDIVLIVTLAIVIPGVVAMIIQKHRNSRRELLSAGATLVLALFFATPASLPAWERLVVLQQIQFPWRWLSIITLVSAYLVAATVAPIRSTLQSKMRPLALIAAGILLVGFVFTATQIIRPAIFVERGDFIEKTNALKSSESYECWWPVWASRNALSPPNNSVGLDGRAFDRLETNTLDSVFTVSQGPAGNFRVATFYYPWWQAHVNGKTVEILPDQNGAITVPLSEERSLVHLSFREPIYVKAANASSIIILILLTLAGGITILNRFTQESKCIIPPFTNDVSEMS